MRRLALSILIALTPHPASAARVPYPPGASALLESVIADTWPAHLQRPALNVAWCESRGNAAAINSVNRRYHGFFQMGKQEWKDYRPSPLSSIYSTVDNSLAAYNLYKKRGWQPWECRP